MRSQHSCFMTTTCSAFCAPLPATRARRQPAPRAATVRERRGLRAAAGESVRRRRRVSAAPYARTGGGGGGGGAQQQQPPQRTGGAFRAPEYYANVGTVIDTLRADYPLLLSETPHLHIFTEHVCFSDASGNCIRGKRAYSNLLWLLRMQAALFLSAHCVSIQSIFHDDCEGCVYIRWRVQFSPRSWTLLSSTSGGAFVIDGMSLYRLDQSGWVYHHSLENSVRRRGGLYVMDRVWMPVRAAEPNVAGVRIAHGSRRCTQYSAVREEEASGHARGEERERQRRP